MYNKGFKTLSKTCLFSAEIVLTAKPKFKFKVPAASLDNYPKYSDTGGLWLRLRMFTIDT